MTHSRIILIVVGVFAILSALAGYTGLYEKLTRDPYFDLKQEAYMIIDQAQLWYSRSLAYGGGSKSFTNLDFQKLKLSDKPGSITYKGKFGGYTLSIIRSDSFDLIAKAPDGVEFEAKQLRFDTRPEIRKKDDS